MTYSTIEKQAIIKLLNDMMIVDGHRDPQEVQYLNFVKSFLGLSEFSYDSSMDRQKAFNIISGMSIDKKMEFAGMLQQMILADGVQDKNEMYFFGEIVTETGIDKAIESKTKGMNIKHDDAQIYLNSSKIALSRRSEEYLHAIDEQARIFRESFGNYYMTLDDKCAFILDYTRDSVKGSGWDLNDVDGVTWFIGNFTDAMLKAGLIDDYDEVFCMCFNKYFNQ